MGAAGTVGACGKLCCSHELQWVVGSRGYPPPPLPPPPLLELGRDATLPSSPAPVGESGEWGNPYLTAASPPPMEGQVAMVLSPSGPGVSDSWCSTCFVVLFGVWHTRCEFHALALTCVVCSFPPLANYGREFPDPPPPSAI